MTQLGLSSRHWLAWNAFAIHPHATDPLSNRSPTAAELRAAQPVLGAFLDLVQGLPVIAVGRRAESALSAIGVDPAAVVRHPSRGGATQFRAGIAAQIEALGLHRVEYLQATGCRDDPIVGTSRNSSRNCKIQRLKLIDL